MHYYGPWQFWFDPFISEMESFSAFHGMQLTRFHQDSAWWAMEFAHPLGGHAIISVMMEREDECIIYGTWNVTDFDLDQLSGHPGVRTIVRPNPEAVSKALNETLTTMCGWQTNELKVSDQPLGWKSSSTREMYEKRTKYPPLLNPPQP